MASIYSPILNCWICFVLFFGLTADSRSDVIRLAADEWCPYNCDHESGQRGIMVDVAERVFKEAGHTIEYSIVPWTRAIEEARNGRFEGIIGATVEEAPDFVAPSEALANSEAHGYVKVGNSWHYNSIQSLNSVAIGVIQGYLYGEPLDSYVLANSKDTSRVQSTAGADALKTNVRKLLAGRIDVLVEDNLVMAYLQKKGDIPTSIVGAGRITAFPVNILFSPSNPQANKFAEILDAGVRRLRTSGEMSRLLRDYGVE